MPVYFVDTSILCNVLPVPGRDQHRADVVREFLELQRESAILILPIAAVIEAGNFIAQIPDGGLRRQTAGTFADVLGQVISQRAPWTLHQPTWDAQFLRRFIDGADTGSTLIQHAQARLGAGDLSILTERAAYRARTGNFGTCVYGHATRTLKPMTRPTMGASRQAAESRARRNDRRRGRPSCRCKGAQALRREQRGHHLASPASQP